MLLMNNIICFDLNTFKRLNPVINLPYHLLVYTSVKYLEFLETITHSNCKILTYVISDEVHGYLPFFEKTGSNGVVINSGPFYGSHGGCIANNFEIENKLVNSFDEYCLNNQIISATLIPSFMCQNLNVYNEIFNPTHKIERYAQFIDFEKYSLQSENDIQSIYHYKTRNMVKKALKNNILVEESNQSSLDANIDFLKSIHTSNCISIGIIPKSEDFFKNISKYFVLGKDYKLFIAYHKSFPVASLLCLYYKSSVEYYVPAVLDEYRSLQPLSAIINFAIQDAFKNGYKFWNWGGTNPMAENLFRFKSRWGSQASTYYYYNKIYSNKVDEITKEEINIQFPFFYVKPF